MARLRAGEAREIILAEARDLFLAHGESHLSFRKIAKQVGVTPMALYRHFESKEDLQIQLLQEGFRSFDVYLSRAESGESAAERLDLLIEGFRDFAFEQSAYFELIFLSGRTPAGLRDRAEVRRFALPTFRRLLHAVRDGIAEGTLRDEGAHPMAVSLLAQCTGLAALHISGTFGWSAAHARRTFHASLQARLDHYRAAR